MEDWFSGPTFHKPNFIKDNKQIAKHFNREKKDQMFFKKSMLNKSNKFNLETIQQDLELASQAKSEAIK